MRKPWKAEAKPRSGSGPMPLSGRNSGNWMNGANSSKRQSSTHSVRGRISGPFPIPDPMDDEFPMRNQNNGAILAAASAGAYEPSRSVAAIRDNIDTKDDAISTPHTEVVQNRSSFSEPSSKPDTPDVIHSLPPKKATPPSDLRHSAVSGGTSPSPGTHGQLQRKKSTLRGAFGRLFGRKRRTDSRDTTASSGTPASERSRRHRPAASDLSQNVGPDAKDRQNTASPAAPAPEDVASAQKRSMSVPISEYDRALRSHSVGPDDVLAIESARNSLNTDYVLSSGRSLDFNSNRLRKRHTKDGEFSGLSPRPASVHESSERQTFQTDDPNEIGKAITSDSNGLKRRSRSLSGLSSHMEEFNSSRRRSDEIRFWRESYAPPLRSPMSSHITEGDESQDVVADDPPLTNKTRPRTPPQPFVFGDMAMMSEMAGMKITQAASMDTRIGDLESRMHRVEQAYNRSRDIAENPLPSKDPIHQDRVDIEAAGPIPLGPSLVTDDVEAPAADQSRPVELHLASRALAPESLTESGRPVSTATIRNISSAPYNAPEALTTDHYKTLVALIETERSSRQALEAQVKRLSQQIRVLSRQTTAYADTNGHIDENFGVSSEGPYQANKSAFDYDDHDGDRDDQDGQEDQASGRKGLKLQPILTKGIRPGVFPEDSGIGNDEDGNEYDDESDAYGTPYDQVPESGFSDDGDSPIDVGSGLEDQEEAYKPERTMSLSQMTFINHPRSAVAQAQ